MYGQNMAATVLDTMDPVTKARYTKKLELINGLDPFLINTNNWTTSTSSYPPTNYHHIFNYLVLRESFCTSEEFGSYKGLSAFNQAYNGWVKELLVHQPPGCQNKIVKAKIFHSMRLSDKPVEPWIIFSEDGDICAAHCTCMAGLGEVCTHVATALFFIEVSNRVVEKETVTGRPAYWKPPCGQRTVAESLRAVDMDFTAASSQRQVFLNEEKIKTPKPKSQCHEPSAAKKEEFFKNIASCSSQSVILSVLSNHQKPFIPSIHCPVLFSSFKNEEIVNKSYDDILNYCSTLNCTCSLEQAIYAEKETRRQNKSSMWHRLREGRITASKLYSVCHTNIVSPSQSLLKSIVNPKKDKLLKVTAVKWGLDNEDTAKSKYINIVSSLHSKFSCRPCGLFISPDTPFLAGSPDGIINCDCCGQGCLEIKCPHSARDMTIPEAIEAIKDFCLIFNNDNDIVLNKKHSYYYQIQCQMYSSKYDYCDFFVWTQKDAFLQRIPIDKNFIDVCIPKCEEYFKKIVLPELVAQYFSRQTMPLSLSSQNDNDDEEVFCICKKPEYGRMIKCDGNCEDWFHLNCVGISRIPKGKWFCGSCKTTKSKRRKT